MREKIAGLVVGLLLLILVASSWWLIALLLVLYEGALTSWRDGGRSRVARVSMRRRRGMEGDVIHGQRRGTWMLRQPAP